MPSKGTTARNVRVSDDVWEAAKVVAKEVGYADVSAYLRDALTMLVEDRAVPWDLRES